MSTTPRARPIPFNAEMVRAIVAGRKTQTRRVAVGTDRPDCRYGVPGDLLWVRERWRVGAWDEEGPRVLIDYAVDDGVLREWVWVPEDYDFTELWIQCTNEAEAAGRVPDADGMYHWEPRGSPCRWRPSLFMPRWAARIWLRVVDVRIERVQDISDDDCLAEGIHGVPGQYSTCGADQSRYKSTPRKAFIYLWDSINEQRGYGWNQNPLVWVVEFERAEKPGWEKR